MKDFLLDAKQNSMAIQENTPGAIKKQKRRVHLYFDENDQMVEREEDEDETPAKPEADLDTDLLKKKLTNIHTKQQY